MHGAEIGDGAEQRHAADQAEQPFGEPGSSTEPAGAGRRDWERPVVRRGEGRRVDQVLLGRAAAGIGVMSGSSSMGAVPASGGSLGFPPGSTSM